MGIGDIELVPFPFTDLTGDKLRPALVLAYNERDMIVAFVTSQAKWKTEHAVLVEANAENGLKVNSIVRMDKITTLSQELSEGTLGKLKPNEIQAVKQSLKQLFKI